MSDQHPPPDPDETRRDPYGQQQQQPPPYGQPPGPGQQPTSAAQPPPAAPPPSQRAYAPYPSGSEGPGGTDTKGFFGALFDFSFNSFVTPKIVKLVYVLVTIALVLVYLLLVITGFAGDEPIVGIVVLLLGWIPFLVYLALARMTLEFYFAIVRMSEDIHRRLPG